MSKRLKFFLSHLSISFLIALLVIGLVFFIWYPSPLALHRYAQALALNNYKHESLQILSSVNQLYGLNYTYNSLFKEDQSLAFAWEYANSRSQLKKSIVNE